MLKSTLSYCCKNKAQLNKLLPNRELQNVKKANLVSFSGHKCFTLFLNSTTQTDNWGRVTMNYSKFHINMLHYMPTSTGACKQQWGGQNLEIHSTRPSQNYKYQKNNMPQKCCFVEIPGEKLSVIIPANGKPPLWSQPSSNAAHIMSLSPNLSPAACACSCEWLFVPQL